MGGRSKAWPEKARKHRMCPETSTECARAWPAAVPGLSQFVCKAPRQTWQQLCLVTSSACGYASGDIASHAGGVPHPDPAPREYWECGRNGFASLTSVLNGICAGILVHSPSQPTNMVASLLHISSWNHHKLLSFICTFPQKRNKKNGNTCTYVWRTRLFLKASQSSE